MYSCHCSAKKPLFTTNGVHKRNPQMNSMQKPLNHGESNLTEYIYSSALPSMAHRTFEEREQKDYKILNTRISAIIYSL